LHLSKELFFLNSCTTWASFNFSGKMELFIDLFIKFVIDLTIAGFANFRSFAEMPSRPVAFFEFALFICFDTTKLKKQSIRTYFYERCVGGTESTDFLSNN
jgi:hypothetical protein